MNFDKPINRAGSQSSKWDLMQRGFGVDPKDGIAMWIADMDFEAPDFLQSATQGLIEKANYGYFCGMESFHEAVDWWMHSRHDWHVNPEWTFLTFGLGHGIATTLQAFTDPGDTIVTFTPVYHEFQAKIEKTGRVNLQLPLIQDADGLYRMDFDAYDALMTGREKLLLISSPHNPAGRVWTQSELTAMAAFCQKHDLLLISDEIHQDLTFAGQKHLTAARAMPEILDRLIITTAASKSFNIAGARTGCVIIPDPALRARFAPFFHSFDISPNLLGTELTKAAYSPQGAEWLDALNTYLEGNYTLFKSAIDAIPGLKIMPMQSTYLSWVDTKDTGLTREEVRKRVYETAKIAATPGHTLGKGGESFLRFNLGTQRALVQKAAQRLTDAFADLR
ncbi:pyridoxal phosphate-dependent aminotransferase [Cognatishimia sp. WU-CL00825]|uniref:MalY/PatB family protein n=1 Tax=Cognatishimia sp. WU-CL00825 TaxID=3127658 RepID=UPI0031044296